MPRICDVDSSDGFTKDVPRRYRAVSRVSPTSSCRVDQALYSKAKQATYSIIRIRVSLLNTTKGIFCEGTIILLLRIINWRNFNLNNNDQSNPFFHTFLLNSLNLFRSSDVCLCCALVTSVVIRFVFSLSFF